MERPALPKPQIGVSNVNIEQIVELGRNRVALKWLGYKANHSTQERLLFFLFLRVGAER